MEKNIENSENHSPNTKLFLKEIECNLNYIKKSNKSKIKLMNKYNNQMNRNMNMMRVSNFCEKINKQVTEWDEINTFIKNKIDNDEKYKSNLNLIKKLKERLMTTIIIREISFSINKKNETELKYSLVEEISSSKSKSKKQIDKILSKNKKESKKNNSRFVEESEYSFSDDSLDFSLMPKLDNLDKLDDLINILKKSKTANEINTNIRKNPSTKLKLKIKLEEDFKRLLLMMSNLEINN